MKASSSSRSSLGSLLAFATAAVALSNVFSLIDAFSPPNNYLPFCRLDGDGLRNNNVEGRRTISTPTSLNNREARRSEKKKKRRSPAFVLDEDDEVEGGGKRMTDEPILRGGGEIGYRAEVPDSSQIPVAVPSSSSSSKKQKKSKLDQELSGERIQQEGGIVVGESVTSAASVSDIPPGPGRSQPDVTTIVTDPDTGIARIQQGKSVMDKVTGRAVVLSSLGPEYRLAQMFPGVPPEVRDRHRFDWSTVTVPQMVEKLREACTVPLKDAATGREYLGVPPHPQISNPAVDFVLSNRDRLGHRMKKTLGRLKLRSQSRLEREEASSYRELWKHFLLLEDHVSAPFRQMLLDAESNVGPNFGNLDVRSYCDG
jgi:hypothetical protein